MAKYYLTEEAVRDLSSIWNYTFDTWSEKQADLYYQQLIDAFQLIAGDTDLGKAYSGIEENLLGFKVNRHIVFYRPLDSKVEITRILHERMDLKSHLE